MNLALVDSPRLTAELLLGNALGWSRVQLLTRFEACVVPEIFERFVEMVKRRVGGEPLQYILGEQEFYGLSFHVTPAVLIPRADTECLVEEALKLAAGRPSVHFVDVGTGSGCIAVTFAQQLPSAVGCAVDLSWEALKVARENAARWKVLDRIQFINGDFLDCFNPEPVFDFVLSNPPYVTRGEHEGLSVMVRDHEPRLALLGGESGLESYHRLIPQAARILKPGGHILLEVGAGQSRSVSGLLQDTNLTLVRMAKDLQGIPRCIIARKDSRSTNG